MNTFLLLRTMCLGCGFCPTLPVGVGNDQVSSQAHDTEDCEARKPISVALRVVIPPNKPTD